jgi:hypothetical protein
MEHTHPITDPVEKIVADTLDVAGIKYHRFFNGLDFTLTDGTQIECKAYFCERIVKQLSAHSDVILIQGVAAAESFRKLINR